MRRRLIAACHYTPLLRCVGDGWAVRLWSSW